MQDIQDILIGMNIMPCYKGFYQIVRIMNQMTYTNMSEMGKLINGIAKEDGLNQPAVERSIGNAIKKADRSSAEWSHYIGRDKVTLNEFLSLLFVGRQRELISNTMNQEV